MEIVNFYPKTFSEIPKQDNPAFGNEKCLMLVREVTVTGYRAKRVVVHLIEPKNGPYTEESVESIAVFWELEIALMFCKSFNPEKLIITSSNEQAKIPKGHTDYGCIL